MKKFFQKLTSRKFLLAVISAVAGIITLLTGNNAMAQTITGAVMTILSTVIYCLVEGVLDAKSMKRITNTIADTAEKLGADENAVRAIEQLGAAGELLLEPSDSPSPPQ